MPASETRVATDTAAHSTLSDERLRQIFNIQAELAQEQIDQLRELHPYIQEGSPQNMEMIQYLLSRVSDGALIEGETGLVHQVSEAVIKKISAGDIFGSIKPYLFRELYNATYKQFSVSKNIASEPESIDTSEPSELPSDNFPELNAVSEFEKKRLLLALHATSQIDALSIVLYKFEGLTLAEVGIITAELFPRKTPDVKAVQSRIQRAKVSIRTELPKITNEIVARYSDQINLVDYDYLDYMLNGLDLKVFQRLILEKKQTGHIALPEKYQTITKYDKEEETEDLETDIEEATGEQVANARLATDEADPTEGLTALEVETLAVTPEEVAAGVPTTAEIDAAAAAVEDNSPTVVVAAESGKTALDTQRELEELLLSSYDFFLNFIRKRIGIYSKGGISAEDLLHDAFLKFYAKVLLGKSVLDVRPYFFSVIRSTIIDFYRKAQQINRSQIVQAKVMPPYQVDTANQAVENIEKKASGISNVYVVPESEKDLPPTFPFDQGNYAPETLSQTLALKAAERFFQQIPTKRRPYPSRKAPPRNVVLPEVINVDELKTKPIPEPIPQPKTPVQLEIFRTVDFTQNTNQQSHTAEDPAADSTVNSEATHIQGSFEDLPSQPELIQDENVANIYRSSPQFSLTKTTTPPEEISPLQRSFDDLPAQPSNLRDSFGEIPTVVGEIIDQMEFERSFLPDGAPSAEGPLDDTARKEIIGIALALAAVTEKEKQEKDNWIDTVKLPKGVKRSLLKYDNSTVPTDDTETAELLELALQRDNEALGKLYTRNNARIYTYIYRRVGNEAIANDIASEVFFKMLNAIPRGNAWHTSFSGWLYRIAHNAVIDYYRQRDRQQQVHLDDISETVATDYSPVKAAENNLDAERLRIAISRLTEEQADVVGLRFLDGYTVSEVAIMLDKTVGSVKALQYRAISTLRQLLQHEDFR